MENSTEQLNNLLKNIDFNGVLLLAEGENILFHKAYGYANRENNKHMKLNSVFELASLSKPFTATAIVILAEKGYLSLNDLVSKWIDGFPYADVTIKHLLNHTSGVPEYMELVIEQWDHSKTAKNSDILSLLTAKEPEVYFAPGDNWAYTNTNYVMLALIIETVSGMPYATYLSEEIFLPLRMKHSYVNDGQTFSKHDVVGYTYDAYLNDYERAVDNPDYAYVTYMAGIQGDGAVHSNVQDLLRFNQAFHTGKLIGKDMLKQALTPVESISNAPFGYGWGWIIEHSDDYGLIIGHNGGWSGFSTRMSHYIDHNKTLIYLCNEEMEPAFEQQLLDAITNILLDFPYNLPNELKNKMAIQVDMKDCKDFVGTYVFPDEPHVNAEILFEYGELYLQVTGQVKVKLYPESKKVFFIKNIGIVLRFVTYEGGGVREMLFEEGEETIVLKKL